MPIQDLPKRSQRLPSGPPKPTLKEKLLERAGVAMVATWSPSRKAFLVNDPADPKAGLESASSLEHFVDDAPGFQKDKLTQIAVFAGDDSLPAGGDWK